MTEEFVEYEIKNLKWLWKDDNVELWHTAKGILLLTIPDQDTKVLDAIENLYAYAIDQGYQQGRSAVQIAMIELLGL
jgi:hypothetical protein